MFDEKRSLRRNVSSISARRHTTTIDSSSGTTAAASRMLRYIACGALAMSSAPIGLAVPP